MSIGFNDHNKIKEAQSLFPLPKLMPLGSEPLSNPFLTYRKEDVPALVFHNAYMM